MASPYTASSSPKKKNFGGGRRKKAAAKDKGIVVNLTHCQYPIIHKVIRQRGWRVAKKFEPYDVFISDNNHSIKALMRMRTHPRTISPVQRVNHFPNMQQLFLKNCLARNLKAILKAMGSGTQPIAPRSWCLPDERDELKKHLSTAPKTMYIVKPYNGLQGHGIVLDYNPFEVKSVQEGRNTVVQEYIDPPMLIDGCKFDLRLYVLILSVDPLKVYIFNDGLARLCTSPYVAPNETNMKHRMAHLTNFSLNTRSKNFVTGPDGHKRCIKAVFKELSSRGLDVDVAWNNIVDVIMTSILAVHLKLKDSYQKTVPRSSCLRTSNSTCYEVLGFDVMLDENMKAWLIEVNHAPSFKGGSKAVDNRIKAGCMRQALELLKVSEKRKKLLTGRVRKEWEKYFHEQARSTAPIVKTAVAATTSTRNVESTSAVVSSTLSTVKTVPTTANECFGQSVSKLSSSPSSPSKTSSTSLLAGHRSDSTRSAIQSKMVNSLSRSKIQMSKPTSPPKVFNPSEALSSGSSTILPPLRAVGSPKRIRSGYKARQMSPVKAVPFAPVKQSSPLLVTKALITDGAKSRVGSAKSNLGRRGSSGAQFHTGTGETFCLDACGFRHTSVLIDQKEVPRTIKGNFSKNVDRNSNSALSYDSEDVSIVDCPGEDDPYSRNDDCEQDCSVDHLQDELEYFHTGDSIDGHEEGEYTMGGTSSSEPHFEVDDDDDVDDYCDLEDSEIPEGSNYCQDGDMECVDETVDENVDPDEQDIDDEDDNGGVARQFKAPMPSDSDQYIKVFSMNLASHRAKYALVIKAAADVRALERKQSS